MGAPALLQEIVSQVDQLPELPHVALQVNTLLNDPDTDARSLAEIITLDPSLTTKVLRLCNSAQYGFSRKIATISEAVSILGHNELRKIIFAIISHSLLNRSISGYGLEQGALWENAVTCASYARHIAQKVQFADTELAFVGALLRDIGKILLESYLQGSVENLEQVARDAKQSFAEAEETVLGASHTEVGVELAIKWNLPDSLANVIRYHHQPSLLPSNTSQADWTLVCIVHLADAFTMLTGSGLGVDGLMYPLDAEIFKHLPLKAEGHALELLYSELLDLRQDILQFIESLNPTKS